jgi:phosphate uptake regulator
MEIRKVQMTGGSSFVISLPKEWIKSKSIQKNDKLGLIVQPDGTLLVTPRITEEPVQKEKQFDVSKIEDPTYLFRNLIGAYIAGYTKIMIKSEDKIQPFIKTGVRKFTQVTIGQEIVEETDTLIKIKDLLNPAEMPFENTITRMHILARSMHQDAITALRNKDETLAQDIISRDNDVDRLHWLVARQFNIVSRDIKLAKKMGAEGTIVNYYLISKIIERIGDHAVRIAENVLKLIDKRIDPKLIDDFSAASRLALKIFNKSIESFLKKDMKSSNENIDAVIKLTKLCEKINERALQYKGEIAISIGFIVESIRRTGEYAGDLSEDVINYLIGD